MPFSHLIDQRGKILSCFAYSGFFHLHTVLQVAQTCNYKFGRCSFLIDGSTKFRFSTASLDTGPDQARCRDRSCAARRAAQVKKEGESVEQAVPNIDWVGSC